MDRGILLPPEERPDIPKNDLHDWVKFQILVQDEAIKHAQELVDIHKAEAENTVHQTGSRGRKRISQLTAFEEGEYVMVQYPHSSMGTTKPNKMMSNWRGPMQVVKREGNNYHLRNLVTKILETKEVHLLKKYHFDPQQTNPEEAALADYTEHWLVEDIVNHKGVFKKKGSLSFEVKWVGFDSSQNTWESWDYMRNNVKLHDYLRKKGLQNHIPQNLIPEEPEEEL
jgi:hypothetical protein